MTFVRAQIRIEFELCRQGKRWRLTFSQTCVFSSSDDVYEACDADFGCLNCCCGGFGCCRQSITGTKDSVAFLSAGGTIVYRNLKEGERIMVDTASVVAIEESVQLGVVSNGRFCMCCCGGEGCFATELRGPGKVFLQVSACVSGVFDAPCLVWQL